MLNIYARVVRFCSAPCPKITPPFTYVKGGVIMDRRGGGERSGVALQNWTTRRLL